MLNFKKIAIILPAYTMKRRLQKTYNDIPFDIMNDVIFDNKMLVGLCFYNRCLGKVLYPTKYFRKTSFINFKRSVKYGFIMVRVSIVYFLHQDKITKSNLYR